MPFRGLSRPPQTLDIVGPNRFSANLPQWAAGRSSKLLPFIAMTSWATTPRKVLIGYAVAFGAWASTALLMATQQLVNHLHGGFDLPVALANCAVFLSIALLTPPNR